MDEAFLTSQNAQKEKKKTADLTPDLNKIQDAVQ